MPMATTPSPISPFPTAQETEYAHHQSVHACAPAAADRCCRSGYIHAAGRGLCRRLGHALGRTAPADPGIGAGAGRQDRRGHHYHHYRAGTGVRRNERRFPQADPDRVRPVDRLRGIELLPVLLQLRRRSAGLMSAGSIDGFEVPLYRALTEPILLGGAPRSEEHTSELQSLMRISYAVFC